MIGMQMMTQGSVNCKFACGSHTPDRSTRRNDGDQTIKRAPAFGIHITDQCSWNIRIPDLKRGQISDPFGLPNEVHYRE